MSEKKNRILLVADFNIENLAGLINNSDESPILIAKAVPFGQVQQVLMDSNHESWQSKPEYALAWTLPEKISPGFECLRNFESVDFSQIDKEVDQFATSLISTGERVNALFVATWTIPAADQEMGMLDYKKQIGVRGAILAMNSRLAELLDGHNNIFLFDSSKWTSAAGNRTLNPKLWYLGKIPFANEVFLEAMFDIKAAVNGLEGKAKKLVVVDLDDTLWGGIVGDIGWENIRLGGHDPVGEAFKDFQKALKALSNRGIILGIVSKNDEANALEAIKKHPEMKLRLDDFAGWKINWNDKAKNLAELVSELNLGMESVVFIDDNPVERNRVRESFPQVLVPEMPEDKLLFPSIVKSLRCFDSPAISEEDRQRAAKYRSEAKRKSSLNRVESIEDWLKSLKTKVTFELLNKVNFERTAQLLNKTNQMNLSTRRMSAAELKKWAEEKNHELWTVRVEDKFGDTGLVGILGLKHEGKSTSIVDFVLSCRVMGRKVEETMAHWAVKRTKVRKSTDVKARFLPTERNQPCLEFWQRSGFSHIKNSNEFSWKSTKAYPLPKAIKLENKSSK